MLKSNPFPYAHALKIYIIYIHLNASIISNALIIISYSILHPTLNSLIRQQIEKSVIYYFFINLFSYLVYIFVIYYGILKGNSYAHALKIYIHLNAYPLP